MAKIEPETMKLFSPLIVLAILSACMPVKLENSTAERPDVKAVTAKAIEHKESFRNLLRHAETGDPIAEYKLGRYYQENTSSYSDAMNWYLKSAEQGDADAQYELGVMYFLGEGVKQDDRQAVTWWKTAADKGHFAAQWNLGGMYEAGKGVEQNNVEAYSFYTLAIDNKQGTGGNDPRIGRGRFKRQLKSLATRMSAEDILQAKKLAIGWKPVPAPGPACKSHYAAKSASVWCDGGALLFVRSRSTP